MIQQKTKLLGVVPKKGSGSFDGNDWVHDHVELHVLVPLPEDRDAVGYSAQIYKLKDCDANFSKCSSLVSKDVSLDLEIQTSGKGSTPVFKVVGISPVSVSSSKV